MKTDPVTRLYDGLTNRERAALAFRLSVDGDALELSRVEASVPPKTYRCADLEFEGWLDAFFLLANLWAVEHWKNYAEKLAAICSFHVLQVRGDQERAREMLEAHRRCESRLLSLDQTLQEVCNEYGIDPEAVRRLAGAEPFVPLTAGLAPEALYQSQLRQKISRLFSPLCQ